MLNYHLLNELVIMSLYDVTIISLVISLTFIYFSFYLFTITQTFLFFLIMIFMIISYCLDFIVNMKVEIHYLLFVFPGYGPYRCDLIFLFLIYLIGIVVSFLV